MFSGSRNYLRYFFIKIVLLSRLKNHPFLYLLFFSSFTFFSTFLYYTKSTLWKCKHQICETNLRNKHPHARSSEAFGGLSARTSFSMDTCARIPNVTVLSVTFGIRAPSWFMQIPGPLLGHWYTFQSALYWFSSATDCKSRRFRSYLEMNMLIDLPNIDFPLFLSRATVFAHRINKPVISAWHGALNFKNRFSVGAWIIVHQRSRCRGLSERISLYWIAEVPAI